MAMLTLLSSFQGTDLIRRHRAVQLDTIVEFEGSYLAIQCAGEVDHRHYVDHMVH